MSKFIRIKISVKSNNMIPEVRLTKAKKGNNV